MAPCSGEAPPCKQNEFLGNVQKARLSGKDVAHIPNVPTQARTPVLHGHPSPQPSSPCQLNDYFPLVDLPPPRPQRLDLRAVYLRSRQRYLEESPRTVRAQLALLLALSM